MTNNADEQAALLIAAWEHEDDPDYAESIAHLVRQAEAAEREACAQLCEQKYDEWRSDPTSNAIQAAPLAKRLADLIRARGNEGEK